MEELITVVVPIYNVEKYLKKCIESILKQTYTNMEIILVNDGSTDSCGEICDEFAKIDKRIKVLHKENGGLSDARNAGLNIAQGKYITFIDSDDFITNNAVELLYKNLIKYQKDISVGVINTFTDENNIRTNENEETILVYDKKESMQQLLYNTVCTSSTAGKLFVTKLFENIKFPYGKKYEDLATVYKLVFESNGVVISNQIVYNYFIARQGSIMNEKFKPTRMDALYFTEEILEFIKVKFPDLEDAAIARLIIECRDILVEIPNEEEYKQYEKILYNYIKKYRLRTIFDKKMPTKKRIALIPILFGKKAIKFAWKIKNRLKK